MMTGKNLEIYFFNFYLTLFHLFIYNNNYYYYLLLESFSRQCKLMVFQWSLSDSKSPQVLGTILSILAILNNVVD